MRLFKTVDERFEEIGFVKGREDMHGVEYERNDTEFRFTQRLHLIHKQSGRHIVQSYDIHLTDDKKIGNTCVGLTMYEMKLCLKKMRQMGWRETR